MFFFLSDVFLESYHRKMAKRKTFSLMCAVVAEVAQEVVVYKKPLSPAFEGERLYWKDLPFFLHCFLVPSKEHQLCHSA
jgi:hypothetical protein